MMHFVGTQFIQEINLLVNRMKSLTRYELFWSSNCVIQGISFTVNISSPMLIENLIYHTNSTSIIIHLKTSFIYNIVIFSDNMAANFSLGKY